MSTKQRVAVGGDGDWSTEASGFLEDDLALLIDSYQTPWWRAVATGGRRRATGWPLPTAVSLVSPPRSPSPAPPTSRPWRRRRNRMDQNCCCNFGPRGPRLNPVRVRSFGCDAHEREDRGRSREYAGGEPADLVMTKRLGKIEEMLEPGENMFYLG